MTLKRSFWIAFALMLVTYLAMVLWSLPTITEAAGGLLPFDLRPAGYSTEEARAFLAALGEEARALYLGPQAWLDLFYPGLMALTLILAYFRLFTRRSAALFSLVALAAAVLDWGENSAVAQLLRLGGEEIDDKSVSIASWLTMLKSGVVTLALIILFAGLARALWAGWKRKAT